MKNYNGSCGGKCWECICQECNGNCAMDCLVDSNSEKNARMYDVETHVVECCLFEPITE